jgi:hypothetical protein
MNPGIILWNSPRPFPRQQFQTHRNRTYCHVSGVPYRIISVLDWMIGFIGTYLQLQSIITADNQWLYKIRSIPRWTTSVFSSTVTDLFLIYESATSLALTAWTAPYEWIPLLCAVAMENIVQCCLSVVTDMRFVLYWFVGNYLRSNVSIRCSGNVPSDLAPSNGGPSTVDCVTSEMCLPNHCLATIIFVTIYWYNSTLNYLCGSYSVVKQSAISPSC